MMNYAELLRMKAKAEYELRLRNQRRDFGLWLEATSPTFTWHWQHLEYIRKQLYRVTTSEINRLMLFMPPRHGKSEMVTVRYPAFFLENNPDKRVIVGAYNQTLANKFSRKTRRIATERFSLSAERTAVEDWETTEGGGLRAVGVGGGITGMGGNLIIIDDPVKNREEANSQTYRDKVWDWYTDDLYTRCEPGATMILIMTRWHQDDLAGRILASDDAPNWAIVNLPALAEPGDPLGRAEGQALCPERYDEEALASIRNVMRESFNALFQQRPSAVEGEIFKREHWRYYTALPHLEKIVHSWDTAFKKGAQNDYSVCTVWGVAANGYYLINRWKGRVEFPELKRTVLALANELVPDEILIEDKASGQSLIQELQRDTRLPIIPVKVDSDKIARAHAVTPIQCSGNIYLPENAEWLLDYIDTLSAFPNGAHDDDVDSTTQALIHMKQPTSAVWGAF
jgi:predicted phage terminase large subunit-like protein